MSPVLDLLGDEARSRLGIADVPSRVEPMLATLVDEPFSDPGWIFERKLDGERCLAYRDADEIRLRSRNDGPLEATYPELVDPLLGSETDRFVVDGEVVAFDGKVTSFERLQQRMQIDDAEEARSSGVAVVYYLFDVVHVDGHDTTDLELRDRKRLLRAMFDYEDPLRFAPHRNQDGVAFHATACERGWEGLIGKDAAAAYASGRSMKWQKLKCTNRQEFVVAGYTEPHGERRRFGAILVGYHEDGDLVYAGKVGTGFDDETLRDLGDEMERIERTTSPFDRGQPADDGVHFLTPELVAEVGFTEWTSGGKLRHPRYLGLRRDKAAREVVRERPA